MTPFDLFPRQKVNCVLFPLSGYKGKSDKITRGFLESPSRPFDFRSEKEMWVIFPAIASHSGEEKLTATISQECQIKIYLPSAKLKSTSLLKVDNQFNFVLLNILESIENRSWTKGRKIIFFFRDSLQCAQSQEANMPKWKSKMPILFNPIFHFLNLWNVKILCLRLMADGLELVVRCLC